MDKDDGVAPVELLHHRPVGRVTEPSVVVARHEADAICFERVVGVLDLFQRGVDVGEGHRREQAKSGRVILHHLRSKFVARSGKAVCFRPVAEPQARIRDGQHCGGAAAAVQVLDRLGGCPGGIRRLQQGPALDLGDPCGRPEMMVHVDARAVGGSRRLSKDCQAVAAGSRGQPQRSEGAGQEAPSIKVGHKTTS